jgi:hypothetical protein
MVVRDVGMAGGAWIAVLIARSVVGRRLKALRAALGAFRPYTPH